MIVQIKHCASVTSAPTFISTNSCCGRIIAHLWFCPRTEMQLRKTNTLRCPALEKSCPRLHPATEANATDGCGRLGNFVLDLSGHARFPNIKPDLVSQPVSVWKHG